MKYCIDITALKPSGHVQIMSYEQCTLLQTDQPEQDIGGKRWRYEEGGGSDRYVGYQIRYTGCRGNKRKLGVFGRKLGTNSTHLINDLKK